jgi:hypothetical protein
LYNQLIFKKEKLEKDLHTILIKARNADWTMVDYIRYLGPVSSAAEMQGFFTLAQNYPNPSNAGTVIPYTLMQPALVELYVCDILGRRVRTLENEAKSPGSFMVQWDGTDDSMNKVASGIYFYHLRAVNHGQTFTLFRKMLLLK